MSDLEQVILDSVNDSVNGVEETPEIETQDVSAEPVEASESPSDAEPVGEVAESSEVPSPALQTAPEATPDTEQDEFSKLVGMSRVGVGGRENRIPYSRVKKINEKSVADAENRLVEAAIGRKLNDGEKAVDIIKSHVARLPELETKVTDYEGRLASVGQFEDVMANDPQRFLSMLSKLPAYAEFFEFVGKAYNSQQTGTPATQTAVPADVEAAMPEPDQTLEDGSKVYTLEGLRGLLDWNAKQVESRITKAYENKLTQLRATYDPVVSDYRNRQRIEATLPIIRKQLDEARTWPLFNESEQEILDVLNRDSKISLEGAYRQVVFPKLVSERNNVRKEVLAELKTAPTATSVTARAATRPAPTATAGPRSLEEIIKEQISTLK